MTLLRLFILFGFVVFTSTTALAAISNSNTQNWPSGTTVANVADNTIHFSAPEGQTAPSPLKTKLHKIKYIGTLFPPHGSIPYLLTSAETCGVNDKKCLDSRAIFLIRANGSKQHQFVHPGKITHPKNSRTLYKARAFYGKCLVGRGDVYVTFQEDKIDRRRYLQHSVFVAEVKDDKLLEKLIVRRRPKLTNTIRRVKKKMCHEIKGLNRRASRRYL